MEPEVSTLTEEESVGSGCGLEFGRRIVWRMVCDWAGVVKPIGGTVQTVAVTSDC